VKEVVSHSTEKMLEIILDEFQQINVIQAGQGLHQSLLNLRDMTQIYGIMTVMFDLTSANTGLLGGLGKKLKELCKAVWEEDKAMEAFMIGLGLLQLR